MFLSLPSKAQPQVSTGVRLRPALLAPLRRLASFWAAVRGGTSTAVAAELGLNPDQLVITGCAIPNCGIDSRQAGFAQPINEAAE